MFKTEGTAIKFLDRTRNVLSWEIGIYDVNFHFSIGNCSTERDVSLSSYVSRSRGKVLSVVLGAFIFCG